MRTNRENEENGELTAHVSIKGKAINFIILGLNLFIPKSVQLAKIEQTHTNKLDFNTKVGTFNSFRLVSKTSVHASASFIDGYQPLIKSYK